MVSIYPIKKNENIDIFDNNQEKYLYEFIATSNAGYYIGENIVAFFQMKKNTKGEYDIIKIKEIEDLPCSTESDSICQINSKYLCVGLKDFNLDEEINGFAIIDIYERSLYKIINDQKVSCIYFNSNNNLLFASMEILEPYNIYFATKIYKIIKNKKNNKNDEIELQNIYTYKNK